MSKKLLLADDSVVIQKLVGLSFANEDIEIIATDNGDDAIARAREIQPDVVLADVVMPGMSGYEVCEAIKQDPALSQIPVLLLTGTFEAFDEARAAAVGATGQITKPFEAQALVERVSEVMNAPAPAPEPEQVTPVAPAASDDFFASETVRPLAEPISLEPAETRDEAPITPSHPATAGSGAIDIPESPSLDLTPEIDVLAESHASASALFGRPGEGAMEDRPPEAGNLSLGQSVEPAADSTPSLSDDLSDDLSGSSRAGAASALPDESDLAEDATIAVTPLGASDPLAAFDDALEPGDPFALAAAPLPPASDTVDLDSALDAVPTDEDATILVAQDDVNASTSPNFESPDDDLDLLSVDETPASSMDSDLSAATDSSDQGVSARDFGASSARNPAMATKDLLQGVDAAGSDLEDLTVHAPTAAIDQAQATAESPLDEGSDGDERPLDVQGDTRVANLDDSLDSMPALTQSAAEATVVAQIETTETTEVTGADAIDLGPKHIPSEAIDYAFDVSEQAPVELDEDPMGDSFSSLMDLSESQILGGPPSDPASTRDPERESADVLAAGYDVSSSDLATAPPPIPTPPEIPLPELGSEITEDIELPPMARSTTAAGLIEVAEDEGIAPFSSEPSDAVEDREIELESTDVDEEADAGASVVEPLADDELAIGLASNADDSRRVPDLTPMMEQQIQETLEKVAWEAFSDLSETIVKQVIGRVEKVAWEVIPQMAETLVREEIRKMKGEED